MGGLASLLLFWIGGAVAVLALAVGRTWLRRAPSSEADVEAEEARYRVALEAWERDRLDDAAAAPLARSA